MNTIRGRLILILLLTHVVLMPSLMYMIIRTVERTMSDAYVDDARSYGQVFASGLASSEIANNRNAVVDLLDAAILGGHCTYAALLVDGESISSSLMHDQDVDKFAEDFEFGAHDDDVYYLSVPVVGSGQMAVLRFGFDETPLQTSIQTIRSGVLYFLIAFVVLSIVFVAIVSSTITGPLKWLQNASRSISSGDVSHELHSTSQLAEIRDLSHDLETMRRKLVGMADLLQEEIKEKELAEAERRGMESFLRQAQRLESLGTLAGGVAHEFNNVLQPILLYTELALEDNPRGTATSLNLRRVIDLAHRAKDLSRQILTFGRQEEHADFRPCDIRLVVYEAVTMIQALLPATIDIRSNLGSEIGRVNCDPAQIKQLVVNLCNNASQAIVGQDAYIDVSLNEIVLTEGSRIGKMSLPPGEFAVLQVADTGRGMDEETIQRIFEPFFTTRDVGDGTGLGLSVVHGIVTKHGGEITVESEPARGTRIRIYLPLAEQMADEFH